MTREWKNGLPFDAVCSECKASLSRGTRYHDCEAYAQYLASRAEINRRALEATR